MVRHVLVLGGGSAGFLAAVTLKIKAPGLRVTVIRSKAIGIIGVGEGTTLTFPEHLHDFLGIDINDFYARAEPQWKLGIRFIWGPRPWFDYGFSNQMDVQYRGLKKLAGYYCCEEDAWDYVGVPTGLMSHNAVFRKLADGSPELRSDLAYHIENEKLVDGFLEPLAEEVGVEIEDDTVLEVLEDEGGVKGLRLASGRVARGDLYVDCSGFASVLLGKTLKEPFHSFKGTLFCDKAVVGGWDREWEPIQPYTVAETMDAGWCWRIDHERRINRGYVYSSAFISDSAAEEEFRRKNPKVGKTRVVKFIPGCYERAWVKNVVAIGNAAGFVEPLEATSLGTICTQCQLLVESLVEGEGVVRGAVVEHFNRRNRRNWDTICQFLGVHYRFNTRLETAFWAECREKVDILGAEDVVGYYREMGPSVLYRHTLLDVVDQFRMEGYLSMLVGQKVGFDEGCRPSGEEMATWGRIKGVIRREVMNSYTVPEALRMVRSEGWRWPSDVYAPAVGMM